MAINEMQVTSINERAAEEYYRRGQDADKDGNHERAAEFYERALGENPDHEMAAFRLAVLYDRRAEDGEDRIDVGGEPRDLLAVEVRHLQWMAVCRPPDRLDHVPEVEATGDEGLVAKGRQRRKSGRIRDDRAGEEDARSRAEGQRSSHSRRSMIVRQRAPRTASLASCS